MLKALFGRGWSWRAACRSRCGQQINRAGVRIRLSTIRTKPAATRSITSRSTAVETVAAIGEAQQSVVREFGERRAVGSHRAPAIRTEAAAPIVDLRGDSSARCSKPGAYLKPWQHFGAGAVCCAGGCGCAGLAGGDLLILYRD